jgi:WD40 repeat protein
MTWDTPVAWEKGSHSLLLWRAASEHKVDGALLRVAIPGGQEQVLWQAASRPRSANSSLALGSPLSPDGRLIASSGGDFELNVLTTSTGRVVLHKVGVYEFAWSPDSRSLVFNRGDPGSMLSILTLAGGSRRFTSRIDSDPAWSPNGRWIAFARHRKRTSLMGDAGPTDVFLASARGGRPRLVARLSERPVWSPNSRRLAVVDTEGRRIDVYSITARGRVKGRLYSVSVWRLLSYGTWLPAWSRSGRLLTVRKGSPVMRALRNLRSLKKSRWMGMREFSPDGRWVTASSEQSFETCGTRGIWLIAVKSGRIKHLTRPCEPFNTSLPEISGTATQGETLSASNGAWTNSPTSLSYRWERCSTSCSAIAGATANTYVLAAADVASKIRILVTAINSYGSIAATSNQTAAVAGAPAG